MFLGDEVFRQGISNFLRRYQYANAETAELFIEMEKVAAPLKCEILMNL